VQKPVYNQLATLLLMLYAINVVSY